MKIMDRFSAMHNERRVYVFMLVALAISLLPACRTADLSIPELLPFQRARNRPLPSPRAQVVAITRETLGVPYVFGGQHPRSGLDCSGLTRYVYKRMGHTIPMGARAQFKGLHPRAIPQPGDLVFFSIASGGRAIDHVGVYVGDFKFIHAPRTGYRVMYDDMRNTYWFRNFAGIRSVFKDGDDLPEVARVARK